jgi:peptidoglycan/xylan/chitin deacetylase (PgdA/CDA1 family)
LLSAVVGLAAVLIGVGLGAVVTSATGIGGGHMTRSSTAVGSLGPPASGHAAAGGSRLRRPATIPGVASIDATLRYTPFVAAGTRRRRVMALTFDDGPSPYTGAIVRVLVKMHVPATFFVVGQQLDDFAFGVRDELRHGFLIGDHTENHAWLIRLNAAGQYQQIHDDAIRLERLGAPFPRLFRPPYGAYNAQTLRTARGLRMLMVLWSIDPGDWRRPGVGEIVSDVLGSSKPGAIVIMHDGGGDRSQTVAALPAIIKGLRRRKYELVNLPELLKVDPPAAHQRLPRLGPA